MSVSFSDQWQFSSTLTPISISGGRVQTSGNQAIQEENEAGLKLVLLLSGQLDYSMHRNRHIAVTGPAIHLSLSNRPFSVTHRYSTATPLQYVAIRLPVETLNQGLHIDFPELPATPHTTSDVPFFQDRQANKTMQGLARQVLLCPLKGGLRQLYLTGKALELTTMALASVQSRQPGVDDKGICKLTSRQLEALHHARHLLLATPSQTPSLAALAREVGLNVTTLTRGFRQLFGDSVYGFVREQRLDLAYRMLATGECTVAQAACASGYSDSHFSKIFQKRFGLAPHKLQP